jgi:hypothetical protein
MGLYIEEPQRESRAGNYPCDITGLLAGEEEHIIIIENQFGKTDHDHLGKLLTHTAMRSAITAIWIAENIADDHRQSIDWLNANTPSHCNFYLAQIKVDEIFGTNIVLPYLDVICRPNIQAKIQRNETSEDKERHLWRRSMWNEILDYIKNQSPPFKLQSPSKSHWSTISIGRSHFGINLLLLPSKSKVGCDLYFNCDWKDEAFQQLLSQKESIEMEIGVALQWLELPDKKSSRILLEVDIDPKKEDNLEKIKKWMAEMSVRFYEVFKQRVAQLQPSNDVE